MAMSYTFQVLENSTRNYILSVNAVDTSGTTVSTNNGSSTGIVAANGYAAITTSFKIARVLYSLQNSILQIQWHQTTNANASVLTGYGDWNVMDTRVGAQGLINPKGTGSTGDIDLVNTAGATVASGNGPTAAMSIILYCYKGA